LVSEKNAVRLTVFEVMDPTLIFQMTAANCFQLYSVIVVAQRGLLVNSLWSSCAAITLVWPRIVRLLTLLRLINQTRLLDLISIAYIGYNITR